MTESESLPVLASTPRAVRLDVAQDLLEITWADDHVSTYCGAFLRWICPCADCRGHYKGQKSDLAWSAVAHVAVRHVEAVGTYALRFDLSDTHDSGIYSYTLLRERCPSTRDDLDHRGRPKK